MGDKNAVHHDFRDWGSKPRLFRYGFSLDKSQAYISHFYVESTKDLEASDIFRDVIMHHKCEHVRSFSLDKRWIDHHHVPCHLVIICRKRCANSANVATFSTRTTFLSQLPRLAVASPTLTKLLVEWVHIFWWRR